MKILFLDDMAVRRRLVQQWFPGNHEIILAKNAYDCVGLYLFGQSSEAPFDLVSLDRDLGERRSGEDVVDQVIRLHGAFPELVRPEFRIHSWNIPAAERMYNRLEWAGFTVSREPFSPRDYHRD
jgi:hypothetical protein